MYSKTYNPERYKGIQNILDAMSDLEEGGRLTLSPLPKEDRNQARYLIYDWLYHMSMKKNFRLQEEDGSLIIRRRSSLEGITFETEQPALPNHLDAIFKHLLTLSTSAQVVVALEDEEGLEEGEVALLKRHWQRVMT